MTQTSTQRSLEFNPKTLGFSGRFAAMASPCEVLIHSDDPKLARHIAGAISQEAWRIEDSFSLYIKENAIYRINNAGGKAVEVEEELAGLLNFTNTCWQMSEGAFDISVGVLRRAWRFDGNNQIPSPAQINALLPLVGWEKCQWDGTVLRLPEGMEIDLGGIVKQYAVDRAAGIASQLSDVPVLIDFGGALRANRPPIDARAWRVETGNPAPDGSKATIELAAGSLATSGDAKRYLIKDGVRYGHVLDPRTGWPVENPANSITVARGQCIEAGLLSMLALLKGKDAEEFLSEQNCPHWVYRY